MSHIDSQPRQNPAGNSSPFQRKDSSTVHSVSNVDTIIAELEACKKAHPDNHIRLLGFNNFAQSAGAAMVIYRGVAV